MTLETHVEALNAKHAMLDQSLVKEMQRPSPDTLKVKRLKKQKLLLKEQLTRIHDS